MRCRFSRMDGSVGKGKDEFLRERMIAELTVKRSHLDIVSNGEEVEMSPGSA
jgi:hypothetical protein